MMFSILIYLVDLPCERRILSNFTKRIKEFLMSERFEIAQPLVEIGEIDGRPAVDLGQVLGTASVKGALQYRSTAGVMGDKQITASAEYPVESTVERLPELAYSTEMPFMAKKDSDKGVKGGGSSKWPDPRFQRTRWGNETPAESAAGADKIQQALQKDEEKKSQI
jgi:hypothetical protein